MGRMLRHQRNLKEKKEARSCVRCGSPLKREDNEMCLRCRLEVTDYNDKMRIEKKERIEAINHLMKKYHLEESP